jgi:ribosomal protein S18 acetylase RimI-like enzyme
VTIPPGEHGAYEDIVYTVHEGGWAGVDAWFWQLSRAERDAGRYFADPCEVDYDRFSPIVGRGRNRRAVRVSSKRRAGSRQTKLRPKIRPATEADLPSLVRLFALLGGDADSELERAPAECEVLALRAIQTDPNSAVMVSEIADRVVGAFHLTFIQYVAFRGGRAAQVQNVVVDPRVRRRGIGEAMMRWAIHEARRHRCFRVQLTTATWRKHAIRFYETMGFRATHLGMRLML